MMRTIEKIEHIFIFRNYSNNELIENVYYPREVTPTIPSVGDTILLNGKRYEVKGVEREFRIFPKMQSNNITIYICTKHI